jgi:hypothetical protein
MEGAPGFEPGVSGVAIHRICPLCYAPILVADVRIELTANAL